MALEIAFIAALGTNPSWSGWTDTVYASRINPYLSATLLTCPRHTTDRLVCNGPTSSLLVKRVGKQCACEGWVLRITSAARALAS